MVWFGCTLLWRLRVLLQHGVNLFVCVFWLALYCVCRDDCFQPSHAVQLCCCMRLVCLHAHAIAERHRKFFFECIFYSSYFSFDAVHLSATHNAHVYDVSLPQIFCIELSFCLSVCRIATVQTEISLDH